MPVRLSSLLLLLAGCGASPAPTAPVESPMPSGSTTIVRTADAVFNVNPDAGTVSRLALASERITEVEVGLEPSRLIVAESMIFVTLRGERAVVRLDTNAFESGVQQRVELGVEPLGIVASPDGSRLYVALSQQDRVVELDSHDLAPLRTFDVPGEPRTLAMHGSADSLFVGLGQGAAGIDRIDLKSGVRTSIALPTPVRSAAGTEVPLLARVTGDPWVVRNRLLVPVLYLDVDSAIASLDSIAELPTAPTTPFDEAPIAYYGAPDVVVDPVTPAVVEVPLTERGEPLGTGAALLAVAFTNGPSGLTGSYLSSVTASEDGTTYLATMQASAAAVLIDARPEHDLEHLIVQTPDGDFPFPSETISALGFRTPSVTPLLGGPGLDGVVWLGPDRAFGNAAFADQVVELEVAGARQGWLRPEPKAEWTVSASPLPVDVRLGRELFFSAVAPETGATGVSCSTCHFEGRTDGLTWTFTDGPRQTPSLAGRVSETAPVTWTGEVETVSDEATLTLIGRLGGEPTAADVARIAAYIDWTRIPDTPAVDPAAAMRGEALFVQSGCADCHSGSRHTDRGVHEIRGVRLDTPSLSGLAASAPYLHDGSAPTLRDVLAMTSAGEMGSTADLTPAELDDLEAYLASL